MFLIILACLVALYFYTTRNHRYWAKKNIKHERPIPLFGTHFRNIVALKSASELIHEFYVKFGDEKVIGAYRGNDKELIVKDPDIIRDILMVDFNSFHNRGLGRDPEKEPLLKNLFHAEDDLWKLLRHKLTPAFTTAKLKSMFPLIVNCAEKLVGLGENIIAKGGDCDIREVMAKFTTEFIGACGLGIEMDTINNESSIFRQIGKKMFSRSDMEVFLFAVWDVFPEIRNLMNLSNKKVEQVFFDMVTKIFEQRNYKPIGRNDFVDLLLDYLSQGKIQSESIKYKNPDGTAKQVEMEMDIEVLVAQVFVFFAAGFETSSSTTSYTLHELAYHPETQKKIQDEIDRVLSKYDNKLCYDAVNEMTLLDMAMKEALRIMPAVGILNRQCVKPYTIKQVGLTIDPDVNIVIPVQSLHLDEKYFDEPYEFKPERFADEDFNQRTKNVYLPFGAGPRACIGARLGQMQSLAGLAVMLHNFSVEPSENTKRTLDINPRLNVVQGVLHGVPIKLVKRK
ncbi:cytochrome P450 6AN5 [Danaus plexippus plexippus]|uniref:unspecific monooxygenase n=1 Tax=Danaus plexippus plexippus TaxID=278856 RepID=A0A212EZY8_DANPL|nr:cytochrome P450 6AN5 [Danaus plexippus plexippus]